MSNTDTRVLCALFAVAILSSSIAAGPAWAVDISRCDAVCSTANCKLSRDVNCCGPGATALQCDGIGPIRLQGSYDLDLNGKKLNCFCGTTTCSGGGNNNALCATNADCSGGVCTNQTGCSSCGYEAVLMEGTGSANIVKSTNGIGTIKGSFADAVSCQYKANSEVSGIKIEKSAADGIGVAFCDRVENDVFVGGGWAIVILSDASGDWIRDNYIEHPGFDGMWVAGTGGISIDHNLMVLKDGVSRFGILAFGSDASITDNVFLNQGFFEPPDCGTEVCFSNTLILGAGGTTANNYCDPATPACAYCIQEGACTLPASPFALP